MKDDEQHKSARKQSTINDKKRQLSSMEQAICERAFVIFQGDIEKIAKALDAPMESIKKVVRARRMELQPPKYVSAVEPIKKKKGKSEYQSMKNSTIPNGSITFKLRNTSRLYSVRSQRALRRGHVQLRPEQVLLQQGLRVGVEESQLLSWVCMQSRAVSAGQLCVLGR